jgi:hypothetical protein
MSAVVVSSQLYAAVAFATCQDNLQLASRHSAGVATSTVERLPPGPITSKGSMNDY